MGKTLNVTLWLTRGFNDTLFETKNIMVDFGMYIDVSPGIASWDHGISSYHKQITWPSNAYFDLPRYVHLKSNRLLDREYSRGGSWKLVRP